MTETPYNVDLMLQVREQITAHPETHNQERWRNSCGTAMCIAGWAVTFAGATWAEHSISRVVTLPGGEPTRISLAARELLGLSAREGVHLFSGGAPNADALALLDRFIDAGKNGQRVCLD